MDWSIAMMRSMSSAHKEILWSSATQMNTLVSLLIDVYRKHGVAMALMIVMIHFPRMNWVNKRIDSRRNDLVMDCWWLTDCPSENKCTSDEFQCQSKHQCVPSTAICDGTPVSATSPPTFGRLSLSIFRIAQIAPTSRLFFAVGLLRPFEPLSFISRLAFPRFCTTEQYLCQSSQLCIPKSNLCDTITQCHDRSDEIFCRCPREDYLSEKLFHRCGLTDKCLPKNIECDIKRDCEPTFNGEDDDEYSCQEKEDSLGFSSLSLLNRSSVVSLARSTVFDE